MGDEQSLRSSFICEQCTSSFKHKLGLLVKLCLVSSYLTFAFCTHHSDAFTRINQITPGVPNKPFLKCLLIPFPHSFLFLCDILISIIHVSMM